MFSFFYKELKTRTISRDICTTAVVYSLFVSLPLFQMKARISVINLQGFQCIACCAPFASVRVLLMFFTSPVKFVLYTLSLFSTQVSENAQLSQLYSSSEDTVARLEGELSRVRGEVVDQQSLMATISQDKESISRAVAQNKDLYIVCIQLHTFFLYILSLVYLY